MNAVVPMEMTISNSSFYNCTAGTALAAANGGCARCCCLQSGRRQLLAEASS